MAQAEERNAMARDPSLPYEPDPQAESEAAANRKDQALVGAEIEKARRLTEMAENEETGRASPLRRLPCRR